MKPRIKTTHIIVHHSATKDGEAKDFNSIRKYHMEVNGWSDIGYHWVIERVNGFCVNEPGRSEELIGAHCKDGGYNDISVGVCVVGNFDLGPMKDLQYRHLIDLLKGLTTRYKIPFENILGHREAQAKAGLSPEMRKTCPGTSVDMNKIRRDARGKI